MWIFPAVQEAQAAARFQRGKPPRNLCHLSFAHVRRTFGRRVPPSAFRLALSPASHGSLASPARQKSEKTGLSLWRPCGAREFLFSVFDMARFLRRSAAEVSPYAACCYAIFFKLLIPAIAGRFISGDEGHGTRQRDGYQVTPKLSLSCPMHAGNKPECVQKMSPPVVKQAAYGETRAANIKKSL
jgi:hypothetical protein